MDWSRLLHFLNELRGHIDDLPATICVLREKVTPFGVDPICRPVPKPGCWEIGFQDISLTIEI